MVSVKFFEREGSIYETFVEEQVHFAKFFFVEDGQFETFTRKIDAIINFSS